MFFTTKTRRHEVKKGWLNKPRKKLWLYYPRNLLEKLSIEKAMGEVIIGDMKSTADNHGLLAESNKKQRNKIPRRRPASACAVVSGKNRRDKWIHRLELSRQAALDLGMRPLKPGEICHEIRLRRGELP